MHQNQWGQRAAKGDGPMSDSPSATWPTSSIFPCKSGCENLLAFRIAVEKSVEELAVFRTITTLSEVPVIDEELAPFIDRDTLMHRVSFHDNRVSQPHRDLFGFRIPEFQQTFAAYSVG